MEKKCSVVGCDKRARSKGLCQAHYMRLLRNGSTDDRGYGGKTIHPLYITWMGAKRGKRLCDEWLDFETFLAAVGERPGEGWRIYRKDTTKPYGPGNVQWRELVHTIAKYKTREDLISARNEARKARGKQDHDPIQHRKRMLKRNYGVTVEQYDQMLKAQNGVCAICGKPETRVAHGGVGIRPLSVDHCHESKNIRGLLCSHCNTALGLLNDDVDLFLKAIEYLKKSGK